MARGLRGSGVHAVVRLPCRSTSARMWLATIEPSRVAGSIRDDLPGNQPVEHPGSPPAPVNAKEQWPMECAGCSTSTREAAR